MLGKKVIILLSIVLIAGCAMTSNYSKDVSADAQSASKYNHDGNDYFSKNYRPRDY